jgi:hypothetical protein
MADLAIAKTVPEFLDDLKLGFTQHATKTKGSQRHEIYFTIMLAIHTNVLYQVHFLLSSKSHGWNFSELAPNVAQIWAFN